MTNGQDSNGSGNGNVSSQDAFWMRIWTVNNVVLQDGSIGLKHTPEDQRSKLLIVRTAGPNPTWQLRPLAHTKWLPDWGIYLHDNGADQAARFVGIFYLNDTNDPNNQGFHRVVISKLSDEPRRARFDVDALTEGEIGRGFADGDGG